MTDDHLTSTDQGTTPHLAKVWMPLDTFIPLTVEGLVRGDPEIAPGFAIKVMEAYEKHKRERVEAGVLPADL